MAKRGKPWTAGVTGSATPDSLVAYFAAQLAASRVDSAVDAAQEIMFDAWDCDDRRRRAALARKALKVSADCADAYVLLAAETATSAEEAIELYRQGVAAGERALGPAAFDEDVGLFWGLLETRPYMRALQGLAMALWDAGRTDEAILGAQEMLRLNPNDNQGVRYVALNWLLCVGRDADATELLRRYNNDASGDWMWSAALASFRKHGDRAASRKALARAVAVNPHVTDYLLGRKKLPRRLPEYISWGGKDEAVSYVDAAAPTWKAAAGALDWLAAATSASPVTPRQPARRGG